ncbi:MAG: biopolymer transporter ExbD [Planctomycetota bacterium]
MNLRPQRTTRVMSFDMTPMIDVVLQLIIFFMFTSQFGELTRSDVRLPAEAGEDADRRQPAALVVDINSAGRFILERREVTTGELTRVASAAVARAGPESAVVVLIRADRDAGAVDLDRVLEALRDAGVTRWRLGTTESTAPREVAP